MIRMALVTVLVATGHVLAAGPAHAQTAPDEDASAPVLSADEAALLEPAVDVGARSDTAAAAPQAAPPAPVAAPAAGGVTDRLDLGTTSITGNQELPKVLYIVPWKRSDLGDLVGRPVNTLLDEVLAPIDPEVFERQLGYYDALNTESREE